MNDKLITIAVNENNPELITEHKKFNKKYLNNETFCTLYYFREHVGCYDLRCDKCIFNKEFYTLEQIIEWLKLDKHESILDPKYNF